MILTSHQRLEYTQRKLRVAEDALRRAIDFLRDQNWNPTMIGYGEKQMLIANKALVDAIAAAAIEMNQQTTSPPSA